MKIESQQLVGMTVENALRAIGVEGRDYYVSAIYDVRSGSLQNPPVQGTFYENSVVAVTPKKERLGGSSTLYLRVKRKTVSAVFTDFEELKKVTAAEH